MAESAHRDYVAIAIDYAKAAVADKARKKHGRWIRAAAQRFLDDLKRSKRKSTPFFFDEWHANDACDFIEKLPHVEGKWEAPTIILHPSHIFFVVQLFGFRRRDAVFVEGWGDADKFYPRRFTSALFAVARKNAKSTLASAILLYCLCCEPEDGAQVISAATTFDQASIIFRVSKRMVEKTPDLAEAFGLQTWAKSISRVETGSSYKALHAKASTQDGLNPSHVGLDEIHAHKTPDLLNVLQSAAGARANPLWLFTTTEGYTNAGPWAEIRAFVFSLLRGLLGNQADHFLALYYALDNEDKSARIKQDDEFDESKWIKANPLLDVNPHLKAAIRKEAVEAKQMPSKLAEFRIKRLNRPASTANGWIDLTKWAKCGGSVDLEWLEGYPCWGGLDLASTIDIAAFRLVWLVEGVWYTHGWRWVPADAVAQRTERATVPYAGWVEAGHLIQTEGDVTDYSVIERDVLAAVERFQVEAIAYDNWNAADLVNRLVAAQVPMVQFVQGTKSYHPAMQALERAYVSGKLAHGGDPVLAWCASNLVARRDVNLSMAPDRKRSADKIDDMAALLMAIGLATAVDEGEDLSDFFNDAVIG
ncbi:terminase large subunit [Alcaligenes ammonioxydans]|uniref:terminase large subunit n=1 Tax=Alcaligenes TaxID=507 RepID=UPI001F065F25|nr:MULTISPECIES: terminase TerL endonuclease subunit [Alcaligenes]MCH1881237.1 terminase large subunit [Alcaligenes ammonioxydans]MCR4146645.1 terminase large subunit [Alcaligenes faecalis]